MRVGIFGSWRKDDSDFTYRGSQDQFELACQEIGKDLARRGISVLVYSESTSTADYHVVNGIVSSTGSMNLDYPLIEVHTDAQRKRPFEALATQFPELFRFYPQIHTWRETAHLISVRKSDTILTIGGHRSAYTAGIAAIVARKPLAPIASFGGASSRLFNDLSNLGEIAEITDLERLNAPWTSFVKDAAFKLLGIIKPHARIFLGYCSKARATANDLTLYLEREIGVSVMNYAMDFLAGGTILEGIEKASRECTFGIFLFTKDDPLAGKDEGQAAPRDNVVFEAGYFMRANGKERTLIVVEEGAKIPADLSNNIYISLKDRDDISTIHTQLKRVFEARL